MTRLYHTDTQQALHMLSISTRGFRWLPQGSWEVADNASYAQARRRVSSPAIQLPVAYGRRKQTPPLLTPWMLQLASPTAHLWCDGYRLLSHLNQFTLCVIPPLSLQVEPSAVTRAFTFLVASQIISMQADCLTLIPANTQAAALIAPSLAGLPCKAIHTPAQAYGPHLWAHQQLWQFSAGEWWDEPKRAEVGNELKYLKKRQNRSQQTDPCRCRKPQGWGRRWLFR